MAPGTGSSPLQAQADAAGELDWTVGVDSSISRVHHHGATAARLRDRSRACAARPEG
jgi:hypothetical protein